jgi:hypothetical protein
LSLTVLKEAFNTKLVDVRSRTTTPPSTCSLTSVALLTVLCYP